MFIYSSCIVILHFGQLTGPALGIDPSGGRLGPSVLSLQIVEYIKYNVCKIFHDVNVAWWWGTRDITPIILELVQKNGYEMTLLKLELTT